MPKMNKREALNGVTQTRKATLSTTKKEDGTLSFIMVSDNNGGQRFDWSSGEYYEEVLSIKGANTSNLNTYEENSQLLADVKFDEDGLSIKRKYENRTLTDVSIGYRINAYEVIEREGESDLVTITDYDILELSAVGIGFD